MLGCTASFQHMLRNLKLFLVGLLRADQWLASPLSLIINGRHLRNFLLSGCPQEGWCMLPQSKGNPCGVIIRVRDKGGVGMGPTAREGEIGGAARKLEKMYGAELGMPLR